MNTRQRLRICVYLGLAPLIPISARLALLQVVRHDDLSSRVETSTARQSIEIVPRGRILDRRGRVLAESLPSWSAFLDLKTFRESDQPASLRLRSIEKALDLFPPKRIPLKPLPLFGVLLNSIMANLV